MTGLAAEIALEGTAFAYDRLYTYTVPAVLKTAALPGCRVLVPFGRGNLKKQGVIFKLKTAELYPFLIRNIRLLFPCIII